MCTVHPNHHSPLLAGVCVCEQATLLPAQVSEDNTKVRRSPLQPLKPKEEKSTVTPSIYRLMHAQRVHSSSLDLAAIYMYCVLSVHLSHLFRRASQKAPLSMNWRSSLTLLGRSDDSTHIHTHTSTHTHKHTHTQAQTHTCTQAHAHTHARKHIHTHAHTHTYASTHNKYFSGPSCSCATIGAADQNKV